MLQSVNLIFCFTIQLLIVMSSFRMWGAYTWLGGGAGGLPGADQGPEAFISLQWDNSSGAQVAPESHSVVRWPRGELAPPQGEKETHTHTHTHMHAHTLDNLQEMPGAEPVPKLGSRL